MNASSGITRRSLLRTGAGAGMVAAVGGPAAAVAQAAAPGTPAYLTRSAYDGLEGSSFSVDTGVRPVSLRLQSVTGEEDAFALTFAGAPSDPLESGIHTMRHPSLGSFELFSSPVDTPDGAQQYEVIVDRSVGLARAQARAPEAPPAPEKTPDQPAREPEPVEAALLRKVSLRSAGRWARCEVVLLRGVEASRVRCRLFRKGKLVASAARDVSERRAVMRLEASKALRPGAYTLVVTALDAEGRKTSERRRITLR